MDQNKQEVVTCIPTNMSAQEFYGCINDSCPICEDKFIAPGNVYKLGNIIYHLNCYLESRNNEL